MALYDTSNQKVELLAPVINQANQSQTVEQPEVDSVGKGLTGLLEAQNPYLPSDNSISVTPYRTEGDTVSGQLEGLLSSDSPYLTRARSSAQNTAASRGLQNSSIAATAGEAAAIDAALPIAQQDAGYFQTQGTNQQSADISSRLQSEQGQIQEGLYETQGDISSRLQSEAAQQASSLSAQESSQAMALQQAQLDFDQIELDAKMQFSYDEMSEAAKTEFNATANAIADDYMQDYMEIMLNPNFSTPEDRQYALDVLAENTKQRYEIAAQIAGVELDWDITSTPQETVAETNAADEGAQEDTTTSSEKQTQTETEYQTKKDAMPVPINLGRGWDGSDQYLGSDNVLYRWDGRVWLPLVNVADTNSGISIFS